MTNLKLIRELIAQGLSDDEIEDAISEMSAANKDHDDAYGNEHEDERSSYEKELCDRLDMGRNEAGEWLGFC
jgi:hypothetical protein